MVVYTLFSLALAAMLSSAHAVAVTEMPRASASKHVLSGRALPQLCPSREKVVDHWWDDVLKMIE